MSGHDRIAADEELVRRAQGVKLLALDVDGVLTDGGLYYGPDGEAFKRFDVKDGHGIVLWRDVGFASAILTARSSSMVEVRARELKIPFVLQGERDKAKGFEKLLALAGVGPEEVAYIGDDVNDLPVLSRVGLAATPADGRPEVKRWVHYVCERPGGHGAVRELCELLLKAKGAWDQALAIHPPVGDRR
ncbi:KdsC family phosphatase [Vulgatibacter incomptus]|uniref:3-deoxy-D-manno-octulosonate 8-phosphate phosphatase n=1 Tax=Vulgatibacter incomptus TaxID=1391653 RepID=A0A0K1PFD6_9BACT|nr:HAD hydrolase family protein [Vulgatibacter incomptus]AKU92238.1 3-deoxy-D-manno-octulosonate 8-phosphate phosphatase [Vulgatibacter incomptus]